VNVIDSSKKKCQNFRQKENMFNIIDSSWENSISLYINSKFLKGVKSFTVKEKISFIKRKTYEYPLEKVVQVGVINEETQKEKNLLDLL